MKLSRQAIRFGLVASLPFIVLASLLEIVGSFSHDAMTKDDAYSYGDGIYLYLGYPLPRIVLTFLAPRGLRDIDNWWAVPLLNVLFVIQWIIWAYLIVLLATIVQNLWNRVLHPRNLA
jgi:hypothetical protein